jgi:hypothetical protein
MSRYKAGNLIGQRDAPESSPSQSRTQPTPASQPKPESDALHSGLGNAAVAAAAAGAPPSSNGNHFSLQPNYGNAAV